MKMNISDKRNALFKTTRVNPWMYKGREGGGGGGWVDATPPYGFSEFFFLEDKTAAPVIFSSCSFTLRAHFETSLVMLSCYGYEI